MARRNDPLNDPHQPGSQDSGHGQGWSGHSLPHGGGPAANHHSAAHSFFQPRAFAQPARFRPAGGSRRFRPVAIIAAIALALGLIGSVAWFIVSEKEGPTSGGSPIESAEVSQLPAVVPAEARENFGHCSSSESTLGVGAEAYPTIICTPLEGYSERISLLRTFDDPAAVQALEGGEHLPEVDLGLQPRPGHDLMVLDYSRRDYDNIQVIDIGTGRSATATYTFRVPAAEIEPMLVELGVVAADGEVPAAEW